MCCVKGVWTGSLSLGDKGVWTGVCVKGVRAGSRRVSGFTDIW